MNKSILVGVAILTLSTSAALAAHSTSATIAAHRTHHGRAMNANASAAAVNPNQYGRSMNANAFGGPVGGWWGGVNSNDHAAYMKNLHDSGYDPKNNFNSNGILKQQ